MDRRKPPVSAEQGRKMAEADGTDKRAVFLKFLLRELDEKK